jgi:TonB family protein
MRRFALSWSSLLVLACGGPPPPAPPPTPPPTSAPAPAEPAAPAAATAPADSGTVTATPTPPAGVRRAGAPPDHALGALMGGSAAAAAPGRTATSFAAGSGRLTKDQIRRVMRQEQHRVRFCYERALIKNPRLAGAVQVRLVIQPSGKVSSVDIVSSTLHRPEVERCIVAAIKGVVFPPPQGGGIVVVRYPYRLEPGDAPAR